MKSRAWSILLAFLFVIGCAKVPISKRRQLNLLPESQLIGMSDQAYNDFLTENRAKIVPKSDPRTQMVERCGVKIAREVENWLDDNKLSKRYKGFEWEFYLIEDPLVNAWCMPGGKVVFYTGILPVTKTETGLAVVMGHEIAHAVARHGNERMSQGLAVQLGVGSLSRAVNQNPTLTNQILLQSIGIGSQLGMLAYSRKHESEADHMGLIFMSLAGYNPREAVDFWARMAAQSQGGAPPEFLSTHPSHDTRIENLGEHMPEAIVYYEASK